MLKNVILVMTFALFSHVAHSKVYQSISPEVDARLVIVPSEGEGSFIIGFDGFGHEYDGQAMLYEKRNNTSDSRDGYYYQMVNAPFTTVRNNGRQTLIQGTIVPYIEVYLNGSDPVPMVLTSSADVAMEQRMLERYEQRQALPVSKVAAKKSVEAAIESFQSGCSTTLEPEIVWSDFSGDEEKAVPGLASHYLNALVEICNIDADYRGAVQDLQSISFTLSDDFGSHKVSLDEATIEVSLASSMENIKESSYRSLFERF
ncbi:hypothetical protein MLC59_12310 [Marinobacter bryozoorum]|uniref:hypothetical protein n=1 Tax=Marinobacter bryozoorum TaxID=256324 RepID=UPI0020050621|nr:hypothetical protein [Marinobacter bryozoorum]MCK7544945.1 hypothetical protein [Marinobacter bryozoorum]